MLIWLLVKELIMVAYVIKFKHSEKEAGLPGLKRIAMSMILILIFAMPAFAVFSSKGQIPNGAPVEYADSRSLLRE